MGVIKDSFTFDDVTLVPQYSSVLPSELLLPANYQIIMFTFQVELVSYFLENDVDEICHMWKLFEDYDQDMRVRNRNAMKEALVFKRQILCFA